MNDKYATTIYVPQISEDGKFIRLVLGDSEGNTLLPLVVSTPNMAKVVEVLSAAVKTAEVTYNLNLPKSVEGFKPTPLRYRVTGYDFVLDGRTGEIVLVLQTSELDELHLVFQPSRLRRLLDTGRDVVETQLPDSDTVN
jgi:hypothetical protein